MKKNTAGQVVGVQMITAADGTAFTGTVTVVVTIDGGTQSASGGTGPTHEGNGFHSYLPTQAETNGDHVAFTFTGTGAIPTTVQVYTTFPQTGDSFARLGAPAGASVSADVAAVKVDTAATLADTGTDGVVVAAGSKTGYSLAADQSGVTVGTVSTLSGHTAQTGDSFARLGAPAGASVSEDIATVDSNIDTLLTRITSTLFSGITSLAEWLGAMAGKQASDATAQTEMRATGAGSGAYDATTDSQEALRDRGDAAWTTGAGGSPPDLLQSTTIATLASQTSFTLTAGSADNDAYNGALVVVTDSATATQKAVGIVLDYVGATKTVTLDGDPGIFTMAVGDDIDIIATSPAASAPSAAAVADAVWDESTSGHTTAGTFGEQVKTDIDAILVDTAEIGTAGAGLTEAGGTGDHLTAVPWNAAWDAEVQSECTDALNAYDPPTKAELDSGFAVLNDPTAAAIADAVLDEALSGHTTAGTLGKAIADTEADATSILTDTAEIGVAGAGLTEAGGTGDHLTAVPWNASWDAEVQSEVTDALDAYDPPTKAELDAGLDALPTAAENATAALTTQMTESYAANGVAPTLAQAQFAIHQALMQFGIAGTSLTVRKLDDSTTAFVVTLDDATAPTDASRV